jgi:hypothetical protein
MLVLRRPPLRKSKMIFSDRKKETVSLQSLFLCAIVLLLAQPRLLGLIDKLVFESLSSACGTLASLGPVEVSSQRIDKLARFLAGNNVKSVTFNEDNAMSPGSYYIAITTGSETYNEIVIVQ